MTKKYLFITLCLLFSVNSFTQESDNDDLSFNSIVNNIQRPKLIYKLSLLSQLDFNSPSLQVGLEVRLSDLVGLHQELGYVNNWLNPVYALIDHEFSKKEKIKNGFKYIFEPRFYFFSENKNETLNRMFFAPALDYRYVVIQRNEWITREMSYQQKILYNVSRMEYGLNLKFGFTTSVKSKMPVEMSFGLGARYITLTNTLPPYSSINQGANNFLALRPAVDGNFWNPSAYIGLLLHLPFK